MSQFSASIEFKFSSNFDKVAKSVNKNLSKITGSFKKLQKQVSSNQQGMEDFTRFLKRGFLVGLAALSAAFAIATIKAMEYEKALAQLSAITGLAGKNLKNFGKQAIEGSNRFGISAAEYLEGVQLIASAKPELLKQPKLLKQIADQAGILAKASGIDLRSAALALTDSMNQFSLGAEDASRAINVLAAGSKFGASLVGDTAAALVKSGVAAKLAGVSFEQTNAAIQVLAKRSIRGSEAGTALRNIFLSLNKIMSATGITDVNEALEKLSPILGDVTKMEKLFQKENINAATILIESRKQFKDMTEQITGTQIALEQARINMSTFGERAARLKQTILNALMIAFEPFINILSILTEKLATGFSLLQKYPRIMTGLVILFGLLTAALGALALGVTLVMMKATIVAFLAAAKAVALFTIALLANPITLIVIGVIALIAALGLLIAKWDNLRAVIVEVGKIAWAFMKGIWEGIKMMILPAFEELYKAVQEAAEPFKELFIVVDDLFGELISLLGLSEDQLGSVANAGRIVGQVIGVAIRASFIPLITLIKLFSILVTAGKVIGNVLVGNFDAALESLKNFVNKGKRLLDPFVNTIKAAGKALGFGDDSPTVAQEASAAAGKSAAALEAQKVITKQSLDVNLKLDGPVKVEKIKADAPVNTTIQSGLMIPEGV